jgi:hypothetical protein
MVGQILPNNNERYYSNFLSATLILKTSFYLMKAQLNLESAIWWKPGPRDPLGPVSALPARNGNSEYL